MHRPARPATPTTRTSNEKVSSIQPLRAVIIVGFSVDRMDVLCHISPQSLRRVLDENRRSLNAKIAFGFFDRAAPGEPRLSDMLLYFIHFALRDIVVHDARPFAGQIQQHLALGLSQGRAFDSFGLNGLPVPTWAQ